MVRLNNIIMMFVLTLINMCVLTTLQTVRTEDEMLICRRQGSEWKYDDNKETLLLQHKIHNLERQVRRHQRLFKLSADMGTAAVPRST